VDAVHGPKGSAVGRCAYPPAVDRRQRSLLQAIDGVYAERDLERFPVHACGVLRELIPSDIAAWNDLDPEAGRVVAVLVPPEVAWEGMHEALMRNIDQNPLYRRLVDAGDHGPYALSDYLTMAQLRALPLYQEVYRRFGIRYQLAAALEAPPPQVLAFTLNRSTADFEPRERQALAALRPHLRRAYDVARELAGLRRDRERLEQEVEAAVRRAELAPRVEDERLTGRPRCWRWWRRA